MSEPRCKKIMKYLASRGYTIDPVKLKITSRVYDYWYFKLGKNAVGFPIGKPPENNEDKIAFSYLGATSYALYSIKDYLECRKIKKNGE
jgi:hypothetical protein